MNNWTNEELLDQIMTKANQIRIISESNDLADMRTELLHRLKLAEGERDAAYQRGFDAGYEDRDSYSGHDS